VLNKTKIKMIDNVIWCSSGVDVYGVSYNSVKMYLKSHSKAMLPSIAIIAFKQSPISLYTRLKEAYLKSTSRIPIFFN